MKNFFAYSEFANNSPGVERTESKTKRKWETSFLLGEGRKFSIHTKVQVYPSPWVIRFGFQLSDRSFLKKKQDFNLR
jgi:hypothetical protein